MFERFTHEAREIVKKAQEEARHLGHNYLGTEHLLLALTTDASGCGEVLARIGFDREKALTEMRREIGLGPPSLEPDDVSALRAIGIDVDEIRRRAEDAFGPGALDRPVKVKTRRGFRRRACAVPASPGYVPFVPRAKKALQLALRESLRLRQPYVGSEHILLALAAIEDSMAVVLLRRQGIDPERVRAAAEQQIRRAGNAEGPAG